MSRTTYHTGDVLEVLATLDPGSVDLVLTSPPFLALRSYLPADHPDKAKEGGQEKTPGEFIDWLLDVVEACDRVLAPHGSMCFELGDTMSDGAGDGWPADKSLTLIPETFRISLAYGINPHTGRTTNRWRIRNVVRWVRPNPPVGALGDKFRPATSEMVVFCRTDEAGRKRYFDLDAVREGLTDRASRELAEGRVTSGRAAKTDDGSVLSSGMGAGIQNPAGAPPLDWWEIPTHPYKGAHYATWPPELCVKPIKAMSPEKVCVTCGEASRRVVESERLHRGEPVRDVGGIGRSMIGGSVASTAADVRGMNGQNTWTEYTTLGWTDCNHDNWRPGVVLDPFAGSGTTLAVAVGHGRDAIGIDLDERNVELARQRVGPMFFEWVGE